MLGIFSLQSPLPPPLTPLQKKVSGGGRERGRVRAAKNEKIEGQQHQLMKKFPLSSSSSPSNTGTEAFKQEGNQIDSDFFHALIHRLQSLHKTSNIVKPANDTFLQSSSAVI